jgi:hypothetical protein
LSGESKPPLDAPDEPGHDGLRLVARSLCGYAAKARGKWLSFIKREKALFKRSFK